MFGKKKQVAPTSGKAHDLALLDRQVADMNARNALEDRGCPTAVATITSVDLADVIRSGGEGYDFMDNQEFQVEASVDVPGADPFTASFPIYLEGVPEAPEVGEEIDVVYDPADRSQVRAQITWRRKYRADAVPTVRWRVPAACPNCGAAVDQSTESLAEHPACQMCRQPLPCEPAA